MSNFGKNLPAMIAALGVAAAAPLVAQATTINFSDYANTYLSSADGVSFSLDPGYAVNGLGTTPFVNAFGNPDQIANSANGGEYPTSDTLTFTFSAPTSNISFSFDNYGESGEGRGDSSYAAYNASDVLVSSGDLGLCNECVIDVAGSGITTLVFNNGTGDPTGGESWLFGVDYVTFGAVPEPAAWALMMLGLGAIGVGLRSGRSRKPLAA
jgi:hypothetical protein